MADLCEELHHTLGVNSMKLKAGVMDPMEEVRVLKLCRQRLGDDFGLRIDPNGTWSVSTAVRVGRALEDLDLQYFEDPAWGLEDAGGPAAGAVRWPRTCIRTSSTIWGQPYLNSIDIILTDLHYWEGPRG